MKPIRLSRDHRKAAPHVGLLLAALLAWVMVGVALALSSCATPVHLAGSCHAHEVGVVRFAGDCPVALCRPVDGGFAWVRVTEDACR